LTPAPPPVVMWVTESGPAWEEGRVAGCVPAQVPDRTLPKGLRGLVSPARAECGEGWSFIHVQLPGYTSQRISGFYVETRRLSTTPPKPALDKAPSSGTAYTRQAGNSPTAVFPLDDPEWTTPVLLPGGEAVERLAPDVIRTASGHEAWVDPFYLGATDPLGDKGYSASEKSVPLRHRFVAGLARAERGRALTTLPPADELAAVPAGTPYVFRFRPGWVVAGRFSPEWFDPVGQTIDHACDKTPRVEEPCGKYELDYTAFGSWLPTADAEVVAIWTGKVLAVQVIEPWGDAIAVSPLWDGPEK